MVNTVEGYTEIKKHYRAVIKPASSASTISLYTLTTVVSVEWCLRKPNCIGGSRSCHSTRIEICLWVTRSSFETNERLDIGR